MLFRNFNYRSSFAHEFSEIQTAMYQSKTDQLCLLLTDVCVTCTCHFGLKLPFLLVPERWVEKLLLFSRVRAHYQTREMEGQEAGMGGRGQIVPLKGLDRILSPKKLPSTISKGFGIKRSEFQACITFGEEHRFSRIMNYQPHLLDEIVKRNHGF